MNANALLEYVSRCGMWFRATVNWDSPIGGIEPLARLLSPPLDADMVCAMPMVKYLVVNREAGTIEGVLFPEQTVGGLALLRENCRALAFASVNN